MWIFLVSGPAPVQHAQPSHIMDDLVGCQDWRHVVIAVSLWPLAAIRADCAVHAASADIMYSCIQFAHHRWPAVDEHVGNA